MLNTSNIPTLPARTSRVDAARILGISAPTMRRMIARGDISGFWIGGREYVSTDSLHNYIATRGGQITATAA